MALHLTFNKASLLKEGVGVALNLFEKSGSLFTLHQGEFLFTS